MSQKEKTLAIGMVTAMLIFLALGAVLLFTGPAAPQASTSFRATVTLPPSRTPISTPTQTPIEPTETPVPTRTPRPTETAQPTATLVAFSPTPTSTDTASPTATRRATAIVPVSTISVKSTTASVPAANCGTPNGNPTNGKLEATFYIPRWRSVAGDDAQVIGTMIVLPSGGGGCYRFNFLGRDYAALPIEFQMNKCGTMTGSLIVTSADGQTWKEDFLIAADAPEFRCK